MLRIVPLSALVALAPVAALAHPHMFVDAGMTLRFDDQGRLGAVGVVWVYDDFSSMLILGDLGLDNDADGNLSEDELTVLTEAARDWPQDFEGDLYLTQGGTPLELSGPLEARIHYRDGRLIETHLRAVIARPDPAEAPVSVRIYDPVYYTAYSLTAAPRIVGREDCRVTVDEADLSAAQKLYADELATLDAISASGEVPMPELGHAFADEVSLQCAP